MLGPAHASSQELTAKVLEIFVSPLLKDSHDTIVLRTLARVTNSVSYVCKNAWESLENGSIGVTNPLHCTESRHVGSLTPRASPQWGTSYLAGQ